MNFTEAKAFALDKLACELANDLHYHCYDHTVDVAEVCAQLGAHFGLSEQDLHLLQCAAYFHDLGFTVTYQEHEEAGCELARQHLPEYGFTSTQIEAICGMIMATKIPQSPQNQLEELLCDADLDYLGRDDFLPIGNRLFRELHAKGIIADEQAWNRLQVKFLSGHRYFNAWSREHREPVKQTHLKAIEAIVATY